MRRTADGWQKTVKPQPNDLDDWTHYLHDSTNNAVSNDRVVAPPEHLQWIGSPQWCRHHDHLSSFVAMVSAKGRLFYVVDEGPRWSVVMPSQWTLTARDAYNGVTLWKVPLEEWHPHLWPLKSGPADLPRRLVAVDDRVFIAKSQSGPVTILDAATGKELGTVAGSEGAEELVVVENVVYTVCRPIGGDGTYADGFT